MLFLICLSILTVALFKKFLTGDQFINGLTICFGFYVGGNISEHYVKKN
jgi:hypothetical protein